MCRIVPASIATLVALMVVSGLAFIGSGCGDCTGVSVPSIYTTVVNTAGTPIADNTELVVEWSVAGADNWQACEGEPGRQTWLCAGHENSGHFDIRATLGEKSGLTTGVLVRHDECHVQTRNIELVVQ